MSKKKKKSARPKPRQNSRSRSTGTRILGKVNVEVVAFMWDASDSALQSAADSMAQHILAYANLEMFNSLRGGEEG